MVSRQRKLPEFTDLNRELDMERERACAVVCKRSRKSAMVGSSLLYSMMDSPREGREDLVYHIRVFGPKCCQIFAQMFILSIFQKVPA